ncbi:transporter [Clostridium polyendosporum]|uniref:Transporter n=1 Tax=Clostridium polyendosporum TaxID=69208 RepID=A0A919RZ49_9CLOT|nr:AzlD domain-containing protein [Clostridium polyendosporum]GIM28150.1 transporter [Clostridium polyendosporum]
MSRILIAVFLMALVTYIPRVLPIIIFKNKLNSRFFKSFLYYMPFAVLGAMTFPNILSSTGNTYSALIGMIVAVVLAYFEQGLMKVAISAVLAVYIFQLFL